MQQNSEKEKLRKSDSIREPIRFIKKNLKEDLIGAEIGVLRGDHAGQMLKYLSIKHLYLIDEWDSWLLRFPNRTYDLKAMSFGDYKRAVQRLKPHSNTTIIKECSIKASQQFKDRTFDFVYIDADHNCASVLADLLVWERKVKKKGVLCGHDYNWYGVKDAIDIYLKIYPRNLKIYNSIRGDWWWRVP